MVPRGLMLSVLLLIPALAGCNDDGPGATGPWTAEDAVALATPHAKKWSPAAFLVGVEGIELAVNATPLPSAAGGVIAPDASFADGRASEWVVAFHDPDNGRVLFNVAEDNTVTQIPDRPMITATSKTDMPPVGSIKALRTARTDAPFDAILASANATLSIGLQGLDPATGELGPRWAFTAWNEQGLLQAVVDGTTGSLAYVRDSLVGPLPDASHAHAAFAMFVYGERVLFDHADYHRATGGRDAFLDHDETPGGDIIHIEGRYADPNETVSMATFMQSLGLEFHPSYVRLDTHADHNGSLLPSANGTVWRFFVADGDGDFQQVFQDDPMWLLDGRRILLTYDRVEDFNEATLTQQQAAVPAP